MNNDLISRSALIERVSGKSYTLSNVPTNISGMLKNLIPYIVKDILNDIENAKTACNVDEVVKQLEEENKMSLKQMYYYNGNNLLTKIMKEHNDKITDIVKAGGVNE